MIFFVYFSISFYSVTASFIHVNTSVNLSPSLTGEKKGETPELRPLCVKPATSRLHVLLGTPLITAAAPHKLPHFEMHEIVIVNLERVFFFSSFPIQARSGMVLVEKCHA